MTHYNTLADEYYVNMNLATAMALPAARETILGFFERAQKAFPTLRNFYTRDNGDFVLEEDKESGHYQWISIESRRVCSGYLNPPSVEAAMEQHRLVLQLVPYMLSVSQLDCESLDFLMGFDFVYRGNHDALVAEALGTSPALDGLLAMSGARVINFEPTLTISLDEACRVQARLMIETRTNAYHVRRGDYPEEAISVFFTLRKYGSLGPETSFEETLERLRDQNEQLLSQCVVDQILRPLAQAIASS